MVIFVLYCLVLEILLKKTHGEYVFYSNKVLLGLLSGGGLQRIQRGYKSHPHELPPILENKVHLRVTESKHHAYTMNTTLTQQLQGLKYSKESHKPKENMNKMLTWIRSRLREKSQKQAQEEFDSARVQAVERALTCQDSSEILPFHSISLSLIQD